MTKGTRNVYSEKKEEITTDHRSAEKECYLQLVKELCFERGVKESTWLQKA